LAQAQFCQVLSELGGWWRRWLRAMAAPRYLAGFLAVAVASSFFAIPSLSRSFAALHQRRAQTLCGRVERTRPRGSPLPEARSGVPEMAAASPPPEQCGYVSWLPSWLGAGAGAMGAALSRIVRHRVRVPVKRGQSPVAEVLFGVAMWGTVREAVRSYRSATQSFQLRDELFQEMAVAHTYKNSITPWIQTGIITLVASIFVVFGVRIFVRSMKEWEQQQEMKEMGQMGEDALFLMSTPVDATPLEKKKEKMRRRLMPWPMRFLGAVMDKVWMFRIGACVGYLLPLLNVLDFGEISISLYPYALGVPPSEPIVNFMQNTLHMRFLYNAYLKSGYYFLIVWFLFIQLAVRNKAAPFFLRFHSSQAILLSMLLGVPQQVFFAVLNPWESGLVVQTFMYHSMVAIFLFILGLVIWCCLNALLKRTMTMPLVSEAAVMWAGKE